MHLVLTAHWLGALVAADQIAPGTALAMSLSSALAMCRAG
jgi:hypothetical protein